MILYLKVPNSDPPKGGPKSEIRINPKSKFRHPKSLKRFLAGYISAGYQQVNVVCAFIGNYRLQVH